MRGLRWAEILLASLVIGSGSLIYYGMAAGGGGRRRYSSQYTERAPINYEVVRFVIGLGIAGLILALILGLLFAFCPGWLGRKRAYSVRVDAVFIASGDAGMAFDVHPGDMTGETRARLIIAGQAEEYACGREAYLQLLGSQSGTAIIDGGLVVAFTPSKPFAV